jgi:Lipoprotein LpqB beta-propeller domain
VASGRFLLWTAAAGASCLTVLAGCAAVPISGVAQPMPVSSGEAQQFVQPLPPPGPTAKSPGPDVVNGFLHASASFAVDPAAARAYLAPGYKWHPAGTVTIVSADNLVFSPPTHIPPAVSGLSDEEQVAVTGQRIATIDRSGQYSYQPGQATKFTFTLARFHGTLLITQLPANAQLLLTQSDFQEVFQPHNLYFYAANAYPSGALVPDPVYAPVQGPNSALSTTVAGSLVNALINDRVSWLAGPTTTEFPAGTTLLRPVTIINQTAWVDLGGKADTANTGQLDLMNAQLWATLTSSAYSPAVAAKVEMTIDGKVPPNLTNSPDAVPSAGSAISGAQKLYFASGRVVKQLQLPHSLPSLVPGVAQLGSPAGISGLAVTGPGADEIAVAVPEANGCLVRTGSLSSGSTYHGVPISLPGGPCTSLSWANDLSLWAVTKLGIFVLRVGSSEAVQVNLPTSLPAGSRVLTLRMAPDAVRAALLVRTGTRTQLYVSAVRIGDKGISFGQAIPVGTDLASKGPSAVSAVTWYNPYFLLAVSGSRIYQVPLTGGPLANGQSEWLPTATLPLDVQTLTAAGSQAGPELVVGTASGTVYTSSAPYFSWTPIPGQASEPVFAG